jgi:Tfp pilus assembly protein PilF
MADDDYQFDDDKLQLSADPDHVGSDDFGAAESPVVAKKSSKRALILLLLVVIIGGAGAFFLYPMLSGSDDAQFTPPPKAEKPVASALPASVTGVLGTPAPAAIPGVPAIPGAPNALGTPPNPVAAPVPGAATITPVNPNPNDVTATALPAPTTPPAAPDAAKTEPNKAVTAITPVKPAAPLVPEAAKPAAVDANAVPKTEAIPPAATKKDVVAAAPSDGQLKPISPADAPASAIADATKSATAGMKTASTDVQKKTAETMAAVNDILGEALPSSTGNKTIDDTINKATGKSSKKPAAPPPPQVVTSRAEQVIQVKRSYSAQSPQAMQAAGERVLSSEQYDAAIQIFDKQLQSNPSDVNALAGKAIALQKANRDSEAMDTYQRLMSLNPRDLEALTNYLGLLQKQKPEEAMTRLNSLAEQYPDNAAVAAQIATVFASQTDTPNALRYFMKARSIDPTNSTYPFNIAVLYDRMGNSDKAADFYRLAIRTAESNPDNASGLPMESIRDRLRHLN